MLGVSGFEFLTMIVPALLIGAGLIALCNMIDDPEDNTGVLTDEETK
jgi:hypothetical protein